MTTTSRDFIRFTLMGADGISRWNFDRPNCPVKLQGVPEGLQGADFELDYRQDAGTDGETYLGRRNMRNRIAFTAKINGGVTGPEFRKLHDRWRASLGDSDNPATFVVVSKESGYRWKKVRLQSPVQSRDWQMPGVVGEHLEAVVLASDSSWWTHPDQKLMWLGEEAGLAAMRNPGDRPAWMRYTIVGPMSGCILGLGGDRVKLGPIPSEGFVVIDTDPAFPTAVDHYGRDLYEMASGDPDSPHNLDGSPMVFRHPLPAGGGNSAPVPLGVVPLSPLPGSLVVAEFTPQSERAW